MNYDSWVITFILVFDLIGSTFTVGCFWLAWQSLQERRKSRIRRLVNKLLKDLHLVSS